MSITKEQRDEYTARLALFLLTSEADVYFQCQSEEEGRLVFARVKKLKEDQEARDEVASLEE